MRTKGHFGPPRAIPAPRDMRVICGIFGVLDSAPWPWWILGGAPVLVFVVQKLPPAAWRVSVFLHEIGGPFARCVGIGSPKLFGFAGCSSEARAR